MGTLSSELAQVAERASLQPRVYADANVPAGVVAFMRTRLEWDVLFVMEHDDLRRAPDDEHFRRAREMRRTLISLDRDYLDDRRFPASESPGVLVMNAPDERLLVRLLARLDAGVFRPRVSSAGPAPPRAPGLPLAGQKLHANTDWDHKTLEARS
jgi:hypothetical protein